MALYKISDRAHATILAALRSWQKDVVCPGGKLATTLELESIATNGGEIEPLGEDEIDAFCEEFNGGAIETMEELEAAVGG